jgi:hypothetical protein
MLRICAPAPPLRIHFELLFHRRPKGQRRAALLLPYVAYVIKSNLYRNLLDGANPASYDKFPAKECANGETRPPA